MSETMMHTPSGSCPGRSRSISQIDLLFIGYGDWHLWKWDGFRTRSAQLCRFLARSPYVRSVFVVNEPLYLRPSPKGFNLPRVTRFRRLPFRSSCYPLEGKIYGIDPSRFLIAPFSWRKSYVLRTVRRHLQRKALLPVLWIANVPMAFLMNGIPCSLRVFDAIDDWEHIAGVKGNLKIADCYETVCESADIIFTVSETLSTKFRQMAPARVIRHVPNGVDLELFSDPAPPPLSRKSSRTDRPVLTYVGVLSGRFDFQIAEAVARAYPHCTLLLVGPLDRSEGSKFRAVSKIPNVKWKGLVHHRDVPNILKGSDVLLIPHRVSPLARSMDPLKLYEYLTTGLPIVATDVPPTARFSRWVYVAKDADSFVKQVEKALQERQSSQAEWLWRSRIEESKRHSWEDRTEKIIQVILENIQITR